MADLMLTLADPSFWFEVFGVLGFFATFGLAFWALCNWLDKPRKK